MSEVVLDRESQDPAYWRAAVLGTLQVAWTAWRAKEPLPEPVNALAQSAQRLSQLSPDKAEREAAAELMRACLRALELRGGITDDVFNSFQPFVYTLVTLPAFDPAPYI